MRWGVALTTIADLKPDQRNANKGTAKGLKMIMTSIAEDGFGRAGLLDKHGNVIAGNKSLEASAEVFGVDAEVLIVESDGTKPIYIKRTDLDLNKTPAARRMAYRDNLSSHFSFALDAEQVMADIETGFDFEAIDVSLGDLGDLLEQDIEGLLNGNNAGKDTEPQIGKADELRQKWGVELGQLWQLGEHRLICGDCTDKTVVERVMGNDRAIFIFTDPPYSVSYADKNASLNAVSFGNRIQTPIENDHLSTEETAQQIWKPAFRNMFDFSLDGCVYYMTMPQGGDQMMMMMMMSENWLVKHELIWVKNHMVLGCSDYHYQHEPIMYGWKPGTGHYFVDDRTQVSTWFIDKPHKSDLHPTTKPVELIEKALNNSSKSKNICLDPFVGSGTTLIACENLDRKGRAIEIDPGYVGVCLQRYLDHTGNTPTLL